MKAVKIMLAIAVVAIIGFFVTKGLINIDPPKDIDLPKNQYTERIESEIDSLKKMPESKFCQKYYNDVQYRINDYFNQGFLGNNESDNSQWQEILLKNLYSAYAPKFVEQAMYVFSRSEWKNDDLKFIRNEVKNLKSSAYLGSTGLVTSFDEINAILAKYDEINNFINACKGYTYSNYDLESTFPDVSEKIRKSRAYITNNLDNSYVNNCTRLKEGLPAIPKILFDKHINYLSKKINDNGARYSEFNYQSDYSNTIYTPLRNQVDALNNDIYGIGDYVFSNGYNSVYNLLSDYNREATNYYKNKRN
ncbi:MAG: hypothetical protein ACOX0V_01265 [Bacteroidales bacterium]